MFKVHEMQGTGEVLVVFRDKVTITPKGLLGMMAKGLNVSPKGNVWH